MSKVAEYTLVFPYTRVKTESNDLYFYSLSEKGIFLIKKIIGGEVFLNYNPFKNELAYLINKKNSDKRIMRRKTTANADSLKKASSLLQTQSSLAS